VTPFRFFKASLAKLPIGGRYRVNINDESTTDTEDKAMSIAVGQAAPDFTLQDQNKKDVKLSDFAGKKRVVLVFYPTSVAMILPTLVL
jgi:cytochrome oxidase Cu insertion factor (SCO1/SenC/PrrC family)